MHGLLILHEWSLSVVVVGLLFLEATIGCIDYITIKKNSTIVSTNAKVGRSSGTEEIITGFPFTDAVSAGILIG